MKSFILCLCFTSSLCGYYDENKIWGQPCMDDNSVPSSRKSAEEVVLYTTWILEQLDSYKDEFIEKLEKHHGTFNELAQFAEHQKKEWIRKFDWYIDEMLPPTKFLGQPVAKTYIDKLKTKIKIEDFKTLTKINAALKFIQGTMYQITKLPDNADLMNLDIDFRRTIDESIRIIRTIICSMNNYMNVTLHRVEILLDAFLPTNLTETENGLMLHDTINYFEYLKQLFEALKYDENVITELPRENHIWANPCNYSPPVNYYFNKSLGQKTWKPSKENATILVHQIIAQAQKAVYIGLKFKNEFAQILCYHPTYNELLDASREDEWLRKSYWYRDEILPTIKELSSELEYSYISKHLMKVFPEALPYIHKGAKLIVSGLNRILNQKIYKKIKNPDFQSQFEGYFNEVQHLLCLLSDYVRARGQEQLWLFDETRFSDRWVFPIYRDSLTYLEYIGEVFEYIARHEASGLDPYSPPTDT